MHSQKLQAILGQQIASSLPPSSKNTFDYLNALKPSSEVVEDEIDNADYDEDIYKTLSSGVYEASESLEVSLRAEQPSSEDHHNTKSQSFQVGQKESDESQSQAVQMQHEEYQQIEQEQQSKKVEVEQVSNKKNEQVKQESNTLLQSVQHKSPELNMKQKQKEQMQFYYPSLMDEQLNDRHEIQNQIMASIRQQTNEIVVEEQVNEQLYQSKIQIKVPQSQSKQYTQIVAQRIQMPIQKLPAPPPDIPIMKAPNQQPSQSINKLQLRPIQIQLQKQEQRSSIIYKANIISYEKEYFLKMQTQIYIIQIHKDKKKYEIRRRFSEFANLQRLIKHNYPGFVLHPLPRKSLQFFKKLKFQMGSQQERIVLIEKRLFELEKYINAMLSHEQIGASPIIQGFIEQSREIFQREFSNLLRICEADQVELGLGLVEQNIGGLKKFVREGFGFISGYFGAVKDVNEQEKLQQLQRTCRKNNELFLSTQAQVEHSLSKANSLQAKLERLTQIYHNNSSLPNLQSSIDSVLNLGSKISSSRSFDQSMAEWIEDSLTVHTQFYIGVILGAKEQLQYRQKLIIRVEGLGAQSISTAEKIAQRIGSLEDRLQKDWEKVLAQFQNNFSILLQGFNTQWRAYCKLMNQIWR